MWFQPLDPCMLNVIFTTLNFPLHPTPSLIMPWKQITVAPSRTSLKKPSVAHLATLEPRPAVRSSSPQRLLPSLHVSESCKAARSDRTKTDVRIRSRIQDHTQSTPLTSLKEMPFLLIPWGGELLCIQLCIDCKSSWQDRGRPIEEVKHGCVAPVFGSAQRLGRSWTSREEEDVDIVSIQMGVECLTESVAPHNVLYDISILANMMDVIMRSRPV